MPPRLKQYLNRSIRVSIPALFENGKCRVFSVRLIETDGLWLSSDELTAQLLPEPDRKTVGLAQPVFVPTAKIAAIIQPPPAATTARPDDAAAIPAAAVTAAPVTAARIGISRHAKPVAATSPAHPLSAKPKSAT
jgi:hypothetical protein